MTRPAEETIEGGGGRLFVRSWRPQTAARGVVAICHGFNAHSGHYQWAADQFTAAGLAVYALDLRGRGRSEGERFYVGTADDYVDDLARLISLAHAREPGLSIHLLGHSAGGVISALYALEHPGEIAGFICEDFAYQVPAPDFALAVLKGVAHLAPHAGAFALNNADFSRDPEHVKAMNEDLLIAHEKQPFQTVAALVHADERLKKDFPRITLPLLILHGAADKATKPSGSKEFYANAGSTDKTLKIYEGRYHDMLNDLGREEVMGDIVGWITARL
ncbi:MAG TPA: alpha/beta hydrolase [Rhizomicrobium sp.]